MYPGGDSYHTKIRAGACNCVTTSLWHKVEIRYQNKGVHHLLQDLHLGPTSSFPSAGLVSHALNLMREVLGVKDTVPFLIFFLTYFKDLTASLCVGNQMFTLEISVFPMSQWTEDIADIGRNSPKTKVRAVNAERGHSLKPEQANDELEPSQTQNCPPPKISRN